jgi:hypothetical protein
MYEVHFIAQSDSVVRSPEGTKSPFSKVIALEFFALSGLLFLVLTSLADGLYPSVKNTALSGLYPGGSEFSFFRFTRVNENAKNTLHIQIYRL